jgi:hypothetical protein
MRQAETKQVVLVVFLKESFTQRDGTDFLAVRAADVPQCNAHGDNARGLRSGRWRWACRREERAISSRSCLATRIERSAGPVQRNDPEARQQALISGCISIGDGPTLRTYCTTERDGLSGRNGLSF